MTYRVRNIAVAVGLALVAALLTTFYVANYKRHVRQSESTVKVFVAKRDIPQGTPGTDLAEARLDRAPPTSPSGTVVPGRDLEPRPGRSPSSRRQTIYAGEQITLRRFAIARRAGHPLPAARHAARASRSRARPTSCSRGRCKDGDHVDVIANLKTGTARPCFAVA